MSFEKFQPNEESSSSETVKTEKEQKWEEKLREVDKILDGKGEKVDAGVKETVAAFNIHDLKTTGSCEGHLDGWGHLHPWIEISTPEPEGFDEVEDSKREEMGKEWEIKNLKQKIRLMPLLEEFYRNRDTSIDSRLSFQNLGSFGVFRVQSLGADVLKILPPEEQAQKRELYLKEMNDFAMFLKDKYLED